MWRANPESTTLACEVNKSYLDFDSLDHDTLGRGLQAHGKLNVAGVV
jgi:hypothetical protein